MICPQCKTEYRPGFTRCADCGMELIEPEAVPEIREDVEYVFIGGSMTRALQLLFLGPLFSMTGNRKMTILAQKPNKDLAFISELFEAGKVVPVIDRCFPLSEVPDALRYLGEGHAKGKVVITVIQNSQTSQPR